MTLATNERPYAESLPLPVIKPDHPPPKEYAAHHEEHQEAPSFRDSEPKNTVAEQTEGRTTVSDIYYAAIAKVLASWNSRAAISPETTRLHELSQALQERSSLFGRVASLGFAGTIAIATLTFKAGRAAAAIRYGVDLPGSGHVHSASTELFASHLPHATETNAPQQVEVSYANSGATASNSILKALQDSGNSLTTGDGSPASVEIAGVSIDPSDYASDQRKVRPWPERHDCLFNYAKWDLTGAGKASGSSPDRIYNITHDSQALNEVMQAYIDSNKDRIRDPNVIYTGDTFDAKAAREVAFRLASNNDGSALAPPAPSNTSPDAPTANQPVPVPDPTEHATHPPRLPEEDRDNTRLQSTLGPVSPTPDPAAKHTPRPPIPAEDLQPRPTKTPDPSPSTRAKHGGVSRLPNEDQTVPSTAPSNTPSTTPHPSPSGSATSAPAILPPTVAAASPLPESPLQTALHSTAHLITSGYAVATGLGIWLISMHANSRDANHLSSLRDAAYPLYPKSKNPYRAFMPPKPTKKKRDKKPHGHNKNGGNTP